MSSAASKARLRRLAGLLYNLANALLLCVFLREAFLIRGDGGAGFGEFVLKGLLALIALAAFAAGAAGSWGVLVRPAHRAPWAMCVLCTCLLAALGALSVWEACSDGAGHCRHWRFVAA
jgi:hypothetical protein